MEGKGGNNQGGAALLAGLTRKQRRILTKTEKEQEHQQHINSLIAKAWANASHDLIECGKSGPLHTVLGEVTALLEAWLDGEMA